MQSNTPIDPAQLAEAFQRFNQVSAQLAGAYQELEQKAERLAAELAVANGALRQQYQEKAALTERMTTLLSALPGAVIELDAAGTIIAANPTALRWLGEEQIGTRWATVVASRLCTTGTLQEWELDTVSDGRLRISLTARELDHGGTIYLLQDITEAHRLREQVSRNERLAAMGEMAAGLAHQLRTPLATALLYAGNLTGPAISVETARKFGGKIVERLHFLERMVQDMLMFVRGEGVGAELFPVDEFLQEVRGMIEPQLAQRGIGLAWRQEVGATRLEGRRKDLQGALLNVFDNAMRAMSGAGEVAFSASIKGDTLELQVRDQGCGMPAEVVAKVFQPFFTTRTDGTGLGLAVVQNVLRSHRGDVAIGSVPGQGTEVTLILPLAADASTLVADSH